MHPLDEQLEIPTFASMKEKVKEKMRHRIWATLKEAAQKLHDLKSMNEKVYVRAAGLDKASREEVQKKIQSAGWSVLIIRNQAGDLSFEIKAP